MMAAAGITGQRIAVIPAGVWSGAPVDQLAGTTVGLCTVVPAVHLAHPLPQVRTAARYLLATRPDKLALREVRPRVTDADPYTRVAAVFALERYTQLWDQATTLLASVFFNPSPDAPHSALYLAARIKHRGLIAPLISRLDEDAALGRIDSSSG